MWNERHNANRRSRPGKAGGFTLIELLIVVTILGILGALVLPRISDAYSTTNQNTMKDELRYLRTQIAVYRAQHRDTPPGYPAGNRAGVPTEALFIDQMTQRTDDQGNCGTTPGVHVRGPYLSRMPVNPVSGLRTVKIITDGNTALTPDNSTGWIYKPQTAEIIPNLIGADSDGTQYAQY